MLSLLRALVCSLRSQQVLTPIQHARALLAAEPYFPGAHLTSLSVPALPMDSRLECTLSFHNGCIQHQLAGRLAYTPVPYILNVGLCASQSAKPHAAIPRLLLQS